MARLFRLARLFRPAWLLRMAWPFRIAWLFRPARLSRPARLPGGSRCRVPRADVPGEPAAAHALLRRLLAHAHRVTVGVGQDGDEQAATDVRHRLHLVGA